MTLASGFYLGYIYQSCSSDVLDTPGFVALALTAPSRTWHNRRFEDGLRGVLDAVVGYREAHVRGPASHPHSCPSRSHGKTSEPIRQVRPAFFARVQTGAGLCCRGFEGGVEGYGPFVRRVFRA